MLEGRPRIQHRIGGAVLLAGADDAAEIVLHQQFRAQPPCADADLGGELGGVGLDELVAGAARDDLLIGDA